MIDLNDDAALVARAKTDLAAFAPLYERYVTKIYNYLYYRTGDRNDAEDLTARVFQRAIAGLPGYMSRRGLPFSAWLYRIAHNLSVNWYRDQGRRRHLALEDAERLSLAAMQSAGPELIVEGRDERQRLLCAIRRLPEDRQQLLILKFVEQLSNVEIGAILSRSEGAVKSLYHRTLLALRDDLSRPGETNGRHAPAREPDRREP